MPSLPKVPPPGCGPHRRAALAWLAAAVGLGRLNSAAAAEPARVRPADLGLDQAQAPLAARYRVTLRSSHSRRPAALADWYFFRDAERIALLKGDIDETWRRDPQGRVAFDRSFHAQRKVADYSPGELATLSVSVDWAALGTFVDARDLLALRLSSRQGHGAGRVMTLRGHVNGQDLQVDWLPALQLPARVQRRQADGRRSDMVLVQHANLPPANWPQPDRRAADYLHLDAADFGDMDYDPVVRLSEALDLRSGWRQPHAHD